MKPLVPSYGDDSPDQFAQKKLIDSEDEDDYTYDDVVRAASKNVVVPPMNSNSNSMQESNRRNDFATDNFDGNSNFSRASNEKSSQLDTQNIIANLMGSLPKPGSSQNPQASYGKSISTIGQSEKPRPKPTVYDTSNPTYSTNSFNASVHQSASGGSQGGFMNQQNRPQFAMMQTANTSLSSMPYYYQQQM